MKSPTPTGFPGWEVPSVGRRVCGRLLTAAFSVTLTALLFVTLFSAGVVAAGVLLLACLGLGLYLELSLAATPGQLALGMRQLDAVTGQPAGGRTFLKYLLMGVLGQLTLGIMVLLSAFSMQPPLRRSWFDRMAGVTVGQRSTVLMPTTGPDPTFLPAPVDQAEPVSAAPLAPPSGPAAARLGTPEAPAPAWAVLNAPALRAQRVGAGPNRLKPAPETEAAETAYRPDPARPAPARMLLDDGTTLMLDRTYVLGRDPVMPSEHADAVPHAVEDAQRSLSKTHVIIGADGRGVWVSDLHSTNGVSVSAPTGAVERLVPGETVRVSAGSTVTFGSRTLRVVT